MFTGIAEKIDCGGYEMRIKMVRCTFLVAFVSVISGLWTTQLALAAWPNDPSVNVPICVESYSQANAAMASDGFGGAIIAWEDYRNGDMDIYAQRVDADGNVRWPAR